MRTLKSFFAIGLLLSIQPLSAQADGQDPWGSAFPESSEETSRGLHGLTTATEVLVGGALAVAAPVETRLARTEAKLSIESMRLSAEEQISRQNLENYRLTEMRRRLKAIDDMEPNLKPVYASQRATYAAELSNSAAKLKAIDELIDKRQAELLLQANVAGAFDKPMNTIEASGRKLRVGKVKTGLVLATGVALLADGAARVGLLLTHRDPGFSPAISAVAGAIKIAPASAASLPEETSTSMTVR